MTPQEFGIRNSEFGISVPPLTSRTRSRFRPACHAGRLHELGQRRWPFVGRPSWHAGRVPHKGIREDQWRFVGQPSWHAGRVPHKGTREDQWRLVGQPSRLPSGWCREPAALPSCHPDRRPAGPQRRDLIGGSTLNERRGAEERTSGGADEQRGRGERVQGRRGGSAPSPRVVSVWVALEEREISISPFLPFPPSALHSEGGTPC